MIGEKSVPLCESFAPAEKEKAASVATADLQTAQSAEELVQPSFCVSAQQRRAFTSKTPYENEQTLGAALTEAKQALPQVKSAYKPSGSTTVTAALLMIAAAPFILAILLGICGGLCFGWAWLTSNFSADDGSVGRSRVLGLLSIGVDLLLVVLMVFIPMAGYGMLSKTFKNRNPYLPAALTGAIDLIVAMALFVPIWKGETLAPTHLTFMFIPIRWVLIVIGGAVVPFIGALAVVAKVSEQKFCERTGVYLRRCAEVQLPFEYAENALALLRGGNYTFANRLPRTAEKSNALITLWWEQGAATAFLELQARFRGEYFARKGNSTAKEKTAQWLAFSTKLEATEAERVYRAWNAAG